MRFAPGSAFPDYQLPDHTSTLRKLSELQGDDPLILTLARGHYCPKEHQQHLELAAFYPKIAVGVSQLNERGRFFSLLFPQDRCRIEPQGSPRRVPARDSGNHDHQAHRGRVHFAITWRHSVKDHVQQLARRQRSS